MAKWRRHNVPTGPEHRHTLPSGDVLAVWREEGLWWWSFRLRSSGGPYPQLADAQAAALAAVSLTDDVE